MLVNSSELEKRLNNPSNLMNRLRAGTSTRKNGMSLFIPSDKISEKKSSFVNPFASASQKIDSNIEKLEQETARVEVLPAEGISPSIDELVSNADDKIALATAHDKSLKLLNSAIDEMSLRVAEIKPEKLPSVIAAASKTVEFIRRERLERDKNKEDDSIHFHFYSPKPRDLSDYAIVHVER